MIVWSTGGVDKWYIGLQNNTSDGFSIYGSAAGANAITIKANNNVGIGTSSPVGKFNIVDGTNKSLIFQDSGIADTFEVASYSASGGTRNLQINAANLIFGTGTSGGSSSTERMRITNSGLVGIGTANPGSNLEVAAAQYPFILITGTNSSQVQAQYGVNQVLQAAYLGTNTNHTLVIHTNGVERMRVVNGGNILMGTTSDNGERLYVSGSIRATGNITANSDLVLKKNLTLVDNPIDKLNQLNGYLYQWKEDDSYQYGVIAQEVEKYYLMQFKQVTTELRVLLIINLYL